MPLLYYIRFFYFFDDQIASIYTTDAKVHHLAKISYLCNFISNFRCNCNPVQGALRGYKDVNVALIMTLIAYWIIGLPLGYILATYTEWAAKGYWIGLIIGLAFGAAFLLIRLFKYNENIQHKTAANNKAAVFFYIFLVTYNIMKKKGGYIWTTKKKQSFDEEFALKFHLDIGKMYISHLNIKHFVLMGITIFAVLLILIIFVYFDERWPII